MDIWSISSVAVLTGLVFVFGVTLGALLSRASMRALERHEELSKRLEASVRSRDQYILQLLERMTSNGFSSLSERSLGTSKQNVRTKG